MTPLYLAASLRRIETGAQALQPSLMERAGLAAAQRLRALAPQPCAVLVLVGPGNNGGDGLVLARHLREWHYTVTVAMLAEPQTLPRDAGLAWHAWHKAGGEAVVEPSWADADWIVDAMFGIGLTRPVAASYAAWIGAANTCGKPILALDVPSGLVADSGVAFAPCVRATHTLSFLGLKPGLFTGDGPDVAGRVTACSLGLDLPEYSRADGHLLGAAVLDYLVPRSRNSHKGSFGSLGILGGNDNMVGAALLAGRAALRLGAGRVYVGLLAEQAPKVDFVQPELMLCPAGELIDLPQLTALAVGPGLGMSTGAREALDLAVDSALPLVLDADALNLLALWPELAQRVTDRNAPVLLTPHPAEAARLLATDTAAVQTDRLQAAKTIAERFQATVILKGVGSVITSPLSGWRINPSGNPGLATAGTGDVLTGMVAALLAQGLTPDQAVDLAAFLHGSAADFLVDQGIGPVGLCAGELIDATRLLCNRHRANPAPSGLSSDTDS